MATLLKVLNNLADIKSVGVLHQQADCGDQQSKREPNRRRH